ncbi:hypothetical protein [Serratia fonticola]|uniref:hypothetical protein n=1 Tax=Serratia fonticola TaxID=47917 RepID=UPI0034671251
MAKFSKIRRAESLAGRYVASQALSKINKENVVVGINPDRGPTWPHSIVGSISQSNSSAVFICYFQI